MDYHLEYKKYEAIIEDEDSIISLLANTSAFLYEVYHDINWVGFYLDKGDVLKLGPFQGKIACNKIAFDKGVCGYAYTQNKTVFVANVHSFPGHIACDANSQSELVIPFHSKGSKIGVLDIDSPTLNRFSSEDIEWFESITSALEKQIEKCID